jgi:hypothetical protein
MDLREIGWGSRDWIQLAQDREREYGDGPSGSGATELVIYSLPELYVKLVYLNLLV